MVDADYRLLPEANGRDILADIADLLRWLPEHLPALAAQEGLTVDLRRTLFTGGSAGDAGCASARHGHARLPQRGQRGESRGGPLAVWHPEQRGTPCAVRLGVAHR
jgi:hypothetical protein